MSDFQPTKISFIKEVWEKEGFRLKKSLSQNFLIDQNIVDKILEAAELAEDDTILEIGPGSGALTKSILEKKASVHAVEIDDGASKILNTYLGQNPLFHLINEDILKADLSFLKPASKVISNLPYHITSPIIAKLAEMPTIFTKIILMVQKEMADRITAKAPSKNRSSFTVFTSYYFTKKSLFTVKPGSFIPKPKVDSVILSLTPKKTLPYKDPTNFFAFVRKCYSQKRKMISSNIRDMGVKEHLESIGCNKNARAEDLKTESFLQLFDLLFPEEEKTKNTTSD
jgi:16S rRNA (adenine1518-N6/adenine1519-N6)-dimethyltransferase